MLTSNFYENKLSHHNIFFYFYRFYKHKCPGHIEKDVQNFVEIKNKGQRIEVEQII